MSAVHRDDSMPPTWGKEVEGLWTGGGMGCPKYAPSLINHLKTTVPTFPGKNFGVLIIYFG